jgi:hypothetical protein
VGLAVWILLTVATHIVKQEQRKKIADRCQALILGAEDPKQRASLYELCQDAKDAVK